MRGPAAALLAAFLFGMSATIAQLVRGEVGPMFIGGLMTLSSSSVFAVAWLAGLRFPPEPRHDCDPGPPKNGLGLDSKSRELLAVVTISGGILAPAFFFSGVLLRNSASTSSLLLISEPALTILLAYVLLRERMSGREYAIALLMLAAAVVVATDLDFTRVDLATLGAGMVILAGLCWAVDNNCSTPLSRRADLLVVVGLKTFLGGAALTAASLAVEGIPSPQASTLLLLFLGGIATVALAVLAFLYSFRKIGAMRGGALFATTTLFGAATAVAVLGEPLSALQLAAAGVMLAASAALVMRTRAGETTRAARPE
jgi:drug/metabolite transporter (DMT)-like permease